MIPKLNLVSALAALVFFFLPWISIECSGERMATQTGVQLITGSATPTREAEARGAKMERRGNDDSAGHSYLAALALIGALAALVISFSALTTGRADLARGSGVLCAASLACLLLQAALGFPVKSAMEKDLETGKQPSHQEVAPLDEIGRGLAKEILARIQVHPTPWFYLELLALGIPSAVLLNSLLDRLRNKAA